MGRVLFLLHLIRSRLIAGMIKVELIAGQRTIEEVRGAGGDYANSAVAMTEGDDAASLTHGGVLLVTPLPRRQDVSLFHLCA
jgi:hypothetical protein